MAEGSLIPFRAVSVLWADAYSEDGWVKHDSTDVTTEHVLETRGRVIYETDRYIVLAGTIGPDDKGKFDVSGVMGIPKGCILDIRDEP